MAILDQFSYSAELEILEDEVIDGKVFRYGNHNRIFAEGDGEALYSFVRCFKPQTVIEIGAGQSTILIELALRKNKAESPGYAPRHICFEPFENAWLETLGPEIRREKIETADLSIFQQLKANDIVFIDSTHVVRPQGDVECEFLKILPVLAPGVLVHIHDIFTPRDYPARFLLERRNFWNEQYILEAFLTLNPHFEVLLAMNDLQKRQEPKLYNAFPMLAKTPAHEPGSFWIRRLPA
jgi:hypothetical protein